MGQYYRPVIIEDNGQITIGDSFEFNNGQKLMEHSYIDNNFVNAVFSKLINHPCRVAWVGDYSDDKDVDKTTLSDIDMDNFDFQNLYDNLWRKSDKEIKFNWLQDGDGDNIKSKDYILINSTKGEYINLSEYIKKNKNKDNGYCINPLPILTCIGNGLGNGDYEGINMELVGSWRFDRIFLMDKGIIKGKWYSIGNDDFIKLDLGNNFKDVTDKVNFRFERG